MDLGKPARTSVPETGLSLAALGLGVAVYLLDRAPSTAYFLAPHASLFQRGVPWFSVTVAGAME